MSDNESNGLTINLDNSNLGNEIIDQNNEIIDQNNEIINLGNRNLNSNRRNANNTDDHIITFLKNYDKKAYNKFVWYLNPKNVDLDYRKLLPKFIDILNKRGIFPEALHCTRNAFGINIFMFGKFFISYGSPTLLRTSYQLHMYNIKDKPLASLVAHDILMLVSPDYRTKFRKYESMRSRGPALLAYNSWGTHGHRSTTLANEPSPYAGAGANNAKKRRANNTARNRKISNIIRKRKYPNNKKTRKLISNMLNKNMGYFNNNTNNNRSNRNENGGGVEETKNNN